MSLLKLTDICKDYYQGKEPVRVLKNINLTVEKGEYLAIMGPSGSGKTTLMNLIGCLDVPTSGTYELDGRDLKDMTDDDLADIRNRHIGFVFQSFHLLPKMTALDNVALPLLYANVPLKERRERAAEALKSVGLEERMNFLPNQLSGGQCQRVAIARAMVTNPDILLADEPTGALDSETSIQIMDILREISKDKLIIMVTHNPELAEEYSNRIIRLVDGKVVSDSNPYDNEEDLKNAPEKVKKTSMSFFTALSLSLNNLMTKKGRTILTAFAGSIGIIGIALILSLSNGVQEYIDDIQSDTMSSYPLSIETNTTDMTAFMSSSMTSHVNNITKERDYNSIYTTHF